jgi:hypothetical protein
VGGWAVNVFLVPSSSTPPGVWSQAEPEELENRFFLSKEKNSQKPL